MIDHASDCTLHNAPAMAPEPCSCGASALFRMYDYDVNTDTFRWRKYCRATLVADVASRALSRAYGPQKVVRSSTLIARAVAAGFTPNERCAIISAWADCWRPRDPEYLERVGIDSDVSEANGAFVTEARRAELAVTPDDPEIKAALALWIDYWATLPEPVILAVRMAA